MVVVMFSKVTNSLYGYRQRKTEKATLKLSFKLHMYVYKVGHLLSRLKDETQTFKD